MAWDRAHGCTLPGSIGRANHLGDPLTVDQIRELPDGAEVVITWDGGNGPHPYRILVDQAGERRVETGYADRILKPWPPGEQLKPMHRVTRGWDDDARTWDQAKTPQPAHILAIWHCLRTGERATSAT